MARKNVKEESFVSKWTLMSAFIMLLVTITALTTATYAWFTANTTVSLGDLDVSVTASSGIQISMDATTWKAGLSTAEIRNGTYTNASNARIDVNQIPMELSAVSTAGTISAGKMLFYKGNVTSSNNNFVLTSTASVETAGTVRPYNEETPDTGDFIAFDIFIQSPANETLYLTATSDVTNRTGTTGLQNAARVAFINLGVAQDPAAARLLATPTTGGVVIWEPNATSHTATGILNASSPYGLTITDDSDATSYDSADATSKIASYYGLDGAFSTGVALTTTTGDTNFKIVNPATLKTVTSQATNSTLFTVSAGISKIRVYCWIEGQDVDCEDRVSGSGIKYQIAITKNQQVATP